MNRRQEADIAIITGAVPHDIALDEKEHWQHERQPSGPSEVMQPPPGYAQQQEARYHETNRKKRLAERTGANTERSAKQIEWHEREQQQNIHADQAKPETHA